MPGETMGPMLVEKNVPLQPLNTFGIVARAHQLVRVRSEAQLHEVLADAALRPAPKFVLGGGSNIVLTGDVKAGKLTVNAGSRIRGHIECGWDDKEALKSTGKIGKAELDLAS